MKIDTFGIGLGGLQLQPSTPLRFKVLDLRFWSYSGLHQVFPTYSYHCMLEWECLRAEEFEAAMAIGLHPQQHLMKQPQRDVTAVTSSGKEEFTEARQRIGGTERAIIAVDQMLR